MEREQLRAVLDGKHPMSGEQLGRWYVTVEPGASSGSAPQVRGFDVTFSAPKTVSLLWAVGDAETRRQVHGGHVAAVEAVMGYVEAQARTRYRLADQSRVCVDTQGVTAALVHQFTSRTGDPQIHTHGLVMAKVQAPDGRWLALDARALKCDQQTLSRLYHAGLEAELGRRLGVEWGAPVGAGHRDVAGIDRSIVEGFSKRSVQAEARIDAALARWRETTGREPSAKERWQLHREAVASSRPGKSADPVDAFERLEAQLVEHHQVSGVELVGAVVGRHVEPVVYSAADHDVRARTALDGLAGMRSVWRPAELLRDLARQTPPVTGHSAVEVISDLQAATSRVIAERCVGVGRLVEAGTVAELEAPEGEVPCRVSDGRPVTSHALDELYTTPRIVQQERYIDLIASTGVWTSESARQVEHRQVRDHQPAGVVLDAGQVRAAAAIADGAPIVLVEGPAGTGKTTMLATAVAAMGGRPVVLLAPTAVAAQEMAAATGGYADTLAKLLWEHQQRNSGPGEQWRLPAGTTVIVDEAGMTATNDMAALFSLSQQHEWRLVLIGDGQQLPAVGRGGMFDHLVDTHPDSVYRLGVVQRFVEPWEKQASLELRKGMVEVLDTYAAHDRFRAVTDLDTAITDAASAWFAAHAEPGVRSVVVTAATNETVTAVNTLIQQQRFERGDLDPNSPKARIDGGHVHVGDEVVTRRNDRDLVTSKNVTVANRQTFTVTAITDSGALVVTGNAGTVTLPKDYVAEHVQLAYASTVHGAQGRTVDRAITIIEPATDHHGLYVAMTRGRQSNIAIVPTPENAIPTDVIAGVLARDWADRPAITRARELETKQRVDVPERSVLRTPATARAQQQTVQPAPRTRVLHDDAARKLISERDRHLTRLELAPRRHTDLTRQHDQLTARIVPLQQRIDTAAGLLDQARQALTDDRAGGWLTRSSSLTRREREHYEHVIQVVPGGLADDRAQLAELTTRADHLTEQIVVTRDVLDRALARIQTIDRALTADAHARLERHLTHPAGVPQDLARHIIDRVGHRPAEPAARLQWENLVAPVVQHHALTNQLAPLIRTVAPALAGADQTSIRVYSREQLQTITAEYANPNTTQPERDILVRAVADDAYRRLDHALANPDTIDGELSRYIVDRLGQRHDHAHDSGRQDEWDNLVADALANHAETGEITHLPDWQHAGRAAGIEPYEQAPQRNRGHDRDPGIDLGR